MYLLSTMASIAALYLINDFTPELLLPASIILGAFIIATAIDTQKR